MSRLITTGIITTIIITIGIITITIIITTTKIKEMIEDWRIEDALGSFNEAMKVIGERWRSGEKIKASGYFQRKKVDYLPYHQQEVDDEILPTQTSD